MTADKIWAKTSEYFLNLNEMKMQNDMIYFAFLGNQIMSVHAFCVNFSENVILTALKIFQNVFFILN